MFTHLHVHSEYSLLDGKSTVNELVDRAIELGMKGMAITDHGNMYGIKEFINYVAKVNGKRDPADRFKPIVGCEMYVAKDRLTDRGDKEDRGYHLVVLAKNEKGYHNLVKLVSKSFTEGLYYKPRTDRYELEAHAEGLIICSACLGGEIPQKLLRGQREEAEQLVLWFKRIWGDDFYLELQRHKTDKPNANYDVFTEQERVNPILVEFARKHDIKLVATNDVHFALETDAEAHDRLICISTQKKFNEPGRMHYTKQEWLKSEEEMAALFPDYPEAIANTNEILDKVETYSIDHAPIMPFFEIPEDFGTEAEYRSRITEQELFDEFTRDENGNEIMSEEEGRKKIEKLGGYDKLYRIKFESDYLTKLTMEGAKRRYGDPVPQDVVERLRFELHIMKTMGFPGYFLIVQDFINVARTRLGVSVGPGRGSAAGSAAAYCLGITDIDPIKYDLLFERFLNPDRISLPDIDVDFDDDGRADVLRYVTDKYGAEKVAHIITFQTMATKSAIKDVAKIMDVPLAESNRIAKMIPGSLPEVNGKSPDVNFSNCLKYVPELKEVQHSTDPRIREIVEYAPQLEGNVRSTGVHACGVIICRDDITDWVPVNYSTDANGERVIATQYEGRVIEETGLIKMDFLGLKTLSIIKEALANIKHSQGKVVDIDHIPLDDPKTFELYCQGNTTATFQFESAGMQQSLRELQPSKFEDLIAMNALYRPGPMDYIPDFIDRKHGRKPIEYDIPIMEKYLHDTYGITVYQEQVMLLSRLLADFTRGESDTLRKAMGKKQKDKLDKLKPKFIAGGKANGHDPKVLEKIWADWEKFASYAFNKSHATCYSWVAYQTGYLKANYPAEYMAGVLSCNLTASDKLSKTMSECKRMKIPVLGPDINESGAKFTVNSKGQIRFALSGIKGVGGGAVQAIVDERDANGPYKDIYDFVQRVNLSACNRSAIESLAKAGAFDCFKDVTREMFLHPMFDSTWSDMLVKYGQRFQQDRNSAQASLFADLEPIETNKPPYPEYTPWTDLQRLELEREMVTIYLSAHPLDSYYMEIKYACNTSCDEFAAKEPQKPEDIAGDITIGGLITNFQTRLSRKNTPFGILELEDFSGKCEIRLFGQTYEKYAARLHPGAAVFVQMSYSTGYKGDKVRSNIERIEPLENLYARVANGLVLSIPPTMSLPALQAVLMKYTESPKRPGRLHIKIVSLESDIVVNLRMPRPIDICRELIEELTEMQTMMSLGISIITEKTK